MHDDEKAQGTTVKTDGGSAAAVLPLPDHIELIRPLGQGATAAVYLVRDTVLKRLAAIKVLRPELAADPVCRRRFEREAQAAAGLSHPNITTVYSVGRLATGQPYIEMQYVDGQNFADRLQARGPFDIEEAVSLLSQLASALAEAHAANLVHRDVKSENILIDGNTKQACLTDFGVAAILATGSDAVTRLTRDGERIGNPRYTSPEQLRGEAVTGQSDVYSLGIIGYEMLAGRGPFDDAEVTSMAGAHIRRPAPDLATMRSEIPPHVADALKRCLAKNPAHRPTAADLAKLLHGPATPGALPAAAGPVAGFLQELKQRKVYRVAATYAALAFLILQVADLVLPAFTRSETLYGMTVLASLAGFPVVVVLAWVFDLRHGRLVRTPNQAGMFSQNATPAQRRVLLLLGMVLTMALAAGLAFWFVSV